MTEMVNHPDHYNKGLKLKGKSVEAIDIIDMFANMKGLTGDQSFLLGTVIKYLSRFPYKGNPVQDLKKADWYLQKLISISEDKKTDKSGRYKLDCTCKFMRYAEAENGISEFGDADRIGKGTKGILLDGKSHYELLPEKSPFLYYVPLDDIKYFTRI